MQYQHKETKSVLKNTPNTTKQPQKTQNDQKETHTNNA